MDKLIGLLRDMLPLEIAVLLVVFIYFLKLFKDLATDFNKIAQQQAEYMKQRVESVDKTTSIFERTVEHQERDLKRLYELNDKLKEQIEIKKEEGIERLDAQLNDVVESLEQIRQEKLPKEEFDRLKGDLEVAKRDTSAKYTSMIESLASDEKQDVQISKGFQKVFVVMPYTKDASERYELIKNTIISEGLEVYRADDVITPGGDIATNVRRCIAEADLILVDITNRNPSVMYELGYTHALEKPVILLASDKTDIPFDVANYRIIIFDGSVRGAEILRTRLREALTDLRKQEVSQKLGKWAEALTEVLPYSNILRVIFRGLLQ